MGMELVLPFTAQRTRRTCHCHKGLPEPGKEWVKLTPTVDSGAWETMLGQKHGMCQLHSTSHKSTTHRCGEAGKGCEIYYQTKADVLTFPGGCIGVRVHVKLFSSLQGFRRPSWYKFPQILLCTCQTRKCRRHKRGNRWRSS